MSTARIQHAPAAGRPLSAPRRSRWGRYRWAIALLALGPVAASAQTLDVEILTGYNLIVDSNVTAPPTYAPRSAYIGARICNTGGATANNVYAYVGNFPGNTPGVFPSRTFANPDPQTHLYGTGSYALTIEADETGVADGTRYIGTLAAGECRVEYWLFSYPQCVNVGGQPDYPPCAVSITGGIKPDDDPVLFYDVWASASNAATTSERRDFTMRNEISASANKIWPNNAAKVPDAYLAALQSVVGWGTLGPDGQPLTPVDPVYPGERIITTQGIWYDIGVVVHGFDNNGDLLPDYNAWIQPVGDPGLFDADCFRMVGVYGLVIVKLKTGGELLIPFRDQLYFENLPENTGVVGLVYYQFVATDGVCTAAMTPYQEAASGFDNEKFSADYGLGLSLQSRDFGTDLEFTKTDGLTSTTTGSTLTYTVNANNANTGVNVGLPDLGMPLVISETIPTGTSFVAASADDSPNTNLTEPTGTGSYQQGFTDVDNNLDTCTINYSISSSSFTVQYSNDGGTTWSNTEPVGVTNIRWLLATTIQRDGRHNGTECIDPDGFYDDGALETSLPPGKTATVRFQVTVASNAPPVVCNTSGLGFGLSSTSTTATDCTLIQGNNSLSGVVFRDDGTGVGSIYGNGTKETNETGIGAGVLVSLYYDANNDGELDGGDILWGTQNSASTTGAYSFTGLPDGPFLVIAKKYDGTTSDGSDNAATDSAFGTTGWGNTTYDPNLPLNTDQGILEMNEDFTTVTLAVNIDLDRSNAAAQSITNVNFGFAPPFALTKSVVGNPDGDLNGAADTPYDEGDLFTYSILLENRLPSVGRQGPTGCQYTAWATTGQTGAANNRNFTNPGNAYDATSPNGSVATAQTINGSLRWIIGSTFNIPNLGPSATINKVEALYFGYFDQALNNDILTNTIGLAATSSIGTGGLGGTTTTATLATAAIDSYIGAPADLDPNSAISWDITTVRPGGGSWSFADFPGMRIQTNPDKSAAGDARTFSLDAIGLRVTTDQPCEAGESTTLSPVPLQDRYDTGSFTFVSTNPPATTVDTGTGTIRWDDVGPVLPGTSKVVTVTVRARDVDATRFGSCGANPPPANNSACNWAETAYLDKNVYYSDGRLANDDSDRIAVTIVPKAELRGTVWSDTDNDGWAIEGGEPGIPGITVTLWGCYKSDGTLETGTGGGTTGKTCAGNSNTWRVVGTTVTDSAGAYEFIGLDTGYYIVEVGNTDTAPGTGNSSPFGRTQTGEADDDQSVTAGNADGHDCPTCDNNWGNPSTNLSGFNFLDASTQETINGINFGYYSANAAIYGQTWWDVDGDATRESGEGGLGGFTVTLYADANNDGIPDGGALQTTTTDASGNYSFGSLSAAPGGTRYLVVVTPPTLPDQQWQETVETAGTGGTVGALNNAISVVVTPAGIFGSQDFGYTLSATSDIGDTVFFDFDGDGVQDPTETGIPDITVYLYQDVDRDGVIDDGVDQVIATDVTDASGRYLFPDNPAGSYIVVVDTADPDFPSNTTATADPDLWSGAIGDLVWLDLNGNGTWAAGEGGIPGVTLFLYRDADGDNVRDSNELVSSTVTNINGNYLFTGLPAGTYWVDVDESTLPIAALALTSASFEGTPIVLASGTSTHLTADAGYSLASGFVIGDRVWHDVDGDGVQDPGEPGIPGVDITVTNGTGTGCSPSCVVTTDESGFWYVSGLTNGNFTVSLDDTDLPRDFTATTGTTDPRVISVSGADRSDIDFGYRFTGTGSSPTGTINGRVFADADGDFTYDALEQLAGTTVNLLDENGYLVATTTTAADGTYSFVGVFIGDYTVEAVDELGTRYSPIFLSAATAFNNLNVIYQQSAESTPDNMSSVSVDGIHDDLSQDFGYQRYRGAIGDTVYQDVNENGTQDLGEPGIAGATVTLERCQWNDVNGDNIYEFGIDSLTSCSTVGTTTTTADDPLTSQDEGGKYLFSNLETPDPGYYYIARVSALPAGPTFTLIADPDTDGVPCTAIPDPDISGDEFPPPQACDARHLVINFIDGTNYLGADFGYRITGTNYASLGDTLWVDTDGDGVRDESEPGIPNITVWIDLDNDSVQDAGETTTTNSDGNYYFTGLPDGIFNVRAVTSDPDWPSGLATTPTFEVRGGNDGSLDNLATVTISGGVVTTINDGDGDTTDTCTGCEMDVDWGYRYAGDNSLSGTICREGATLDGFCGATNTTYSGPAPDESALGGITVYLYQWTDDGDNDAWGPTGAADSGDSFVLFGSTTTDAFGNYSFTNVPDNVVVVFGIPAAQSLDLTTTGANTSVEDANVVTRELYEGTSTYDGNTVTTFVGQALNLAGDADNIIQDLDFAFDPTLGGAIAFDFGDLPSSYSNTLLEDGARNRVEPGSIRLGTLVDTEGNGTEDANATGDAGDDGITNIPADFPTCTGSTCGTDPGNDPRFTGTFNAEASTDGWLLGWIDWNRDGDFDDAGEMFVDQAVSTGMQSVNFQIPTDLPSGSLQFFTRFRIYPSRPLFAASTGVALDSFFQPMSGEVEDYLWNVEVTAALVTGFSAHYENGAVVLEWETDSEVGTVGFYLKRWNAESRRWEAVNDELLPGLLTAPQGGRYRYEDRDARPSEKTWYRLIEVETSGLRRTYGPFKVNTDLPGRFPVRLGDPESAEHEAAAALDLLADPVVNGYAKRAHPAPAAVDASARTAAAPPAVRPALGGRQVVGAKIAVDEPGIYYLSVDDVLAAGFAVDRTGLAGNRNVYTLANRGNPVAVTPAPNGLYFYGEGIDSIFTADNVYWLGVGARPSPRMKQQKTKPTIRPTGDETFVRTERYEEDRVPATVLFADPLRSFWLWDYVVAGQPAKGFAFRTDAVDTESGDVEILVRLQGATEATAGPDHHAEISINGQYVGDAQFDGTSAVELVLEVDGELLVDGENTLEIGGTLDSGAPYSIFYLDWVEVRYASRFQARQNRLTFSSDHHASIRVGGFTSRDLMVFDITNPRDPVVLKAEIERDGTGWAVTLAPSGPNRRLIALARDAAQRADRIKPDTPSSLWAPANAGEYLVITTSELAATAERLVDHRSDLSGQVVDIEDVWDEFNFGIADPRALRSFLSHARSSWSEGPQYVLLGGDGHYDYENHFGYGGNLIPPMMANTPFGLFPSDSWFADLDPSTAAPEIAIGRLPATTAAELEVMIDKIIAREQSAGAGWLDQLLLVSDNPDRAGAFPADNDAIGLFAGPGAVVSEIDLSTTALADARTQLLGSLNLGVGLTSYVGHGGLTLLANEGLLTSADLGSLGNAGAGTVLTALTCYTGNFSFPGYPSLSEELVRSANGGAVAVWAPSGMSQNEQAVALGKAFYQAAFSSFEVRLGDAVVDAATAYLQANRARYMTDMFVLLGDPAMPLR
jgi:hypothetical protein